ncbi:MAG: hypothetical protein AB7E13_08555 [Arcobacteraceae bacterium]
MSRYKVAFTLKQHTPLIHFQSEQSGATLRASELKPKFDRFLLKLKNPNITPSKGPQGELYFNYKVKITSLGNSIEDIEKINPHNGKKIPDPLFFGNMGEGAKKRFTHAKELHIEFLCFVPQLKEMIENNFEAFLAQTNFGTRQSKGYGSFYLDKPFNTSLIPYKVYSFNSTNWKNDIKLIYSFLRQGINYPKGRDVTRFYCKPAIFGYALKNNWTWDKKAIKQHFFPQDLQAQQSKHPASSPVGYQGTKTFLLRDLFGLSSDQTWMSYKTNIKKEHKEIARFKSPLHFKIIQNQVYFWADKSVEKILGKTFKISAKGNRPLELQTPDSFSFDAFFDYVKSIDLATHIEQKYHKESEFNTLNRILNGIKASK